MWRSYFGEKCHVYGIDILEDCKKYENEHISVFIGDKGDRNFWKTFKERVKGIDIIIDDAGHTPELQQITLEELLPILNSGGVYVCEDISGRFNGFSAFSSGLVSELNYCNIISGSLDYSKFKIESGYSIQSSVVPFQSSIGSIHFYPFIMVIEKHYKPITKLTSLRQGTEWLTNQLSNHQKS